MEKVNLLRRLEIGSVVAEQDSLLSRCFVKHPVLDEFIFDRKDIILGAKGSGKSALWKAIKDAQESYEDLKDVLLCPVTNPSGDPEFRGVLAAIASESFPGAEDLRVAWRIYFLSQLWKASEPVLAELWEEREIKSSMNKYGILPEEGDTFSRFFAYAISKARALRRLDLKWKEGIFFEFDEVSLMAGGSELAIPFNDLMTQIDNSLKEVGKKVWLVLDRLDEIVLGDEEKENRVLKGLLLAFREMCDYENAKIKIFLRDDVYNRVTSIGQFPALTHVRSKATVPIRWELEDLRHLIVRRLLANELIKERVGNTDVLSHTSADRKRIYYLFFPEKVDQGRSAEGFKWIVDRITDGNGISTPRDLLSVVDTARQYQIEQINRDSLNLPGDQLFTEDTLRKSVRKVAKDNLETRIFAEYPDLKDHIRAFENRKADHNQESLKNILGDNWQTILERLKNVGFLYKRTRKGIDVWTVPFFYSFALDIKRGAEFDFQPDQ
jgi:hypothetical protein